MVQKLGLVIHKFLRALRLLQDDGELEMFDLERERILFRARPRFVKWEPEEHEVADVIDLLSQIAEGFAVELKLPEDISQIEWQTIALLDRYLHSKSVAGDNYRVEFE